MHITVLHHGRKWKRVENHMRCHYCATCGATVHQSQGEVAQKRHEQWHAELIRVLQIVADRAEPEAGESPPWTAAVDEQDDPEAIEAG